MKHFSDACNLPDVALHASGHRHGTLDWVGMSGIQTLVRFDAGNGEVQNTGARIDMHVNLIDPDKRGIHMSRLYLLADEYLSEQVIDAPMLESLLRSALATHETLSDRARIRVRFEHLVRRQSLRSKHSGWRCYPVSIDAQLGPDGFYLELGTEVLYSSTCPASAALSRQLIKEQFTKDFEPDQSLDHALVAAWLGSERGIVATPHAQRSVARVFVRPADGVPLDLLTLLDSVEQSLGTPVQSAVKREDEQAFALANGSNLMFCEDAARRIHAALEDCPDFIDFRIHVEHQESLHPHDAVAHTRKRYGCQ